MSLLDNEVLFRPFGLKTDEVTRNGDKYVTKSSLFIFFTWCFVNQVKKGETDEALRTHRGNKISIQNYVWESS